MKIKFYDKKSGHIIFIGLAGIEGVPRVGEVVCRRNEEWEIVSLHKVVAITYDYNHEDELVDAKVLLSPMPLPERKKKRASRKSP